MNVVIAGGGTGGHFFPGLAVAEELATVHGASILFVGSAYGIEARAVPRTPFSFRALEIRGARGGGWRAAMSFALRAPVATAYAWTLLRRFDPHLVVGLGGYGSVPVVVAAFLRGTPIVLLEQNARPGMANRILARLSTRVCTNFPESAVSFPKGKTVHTGNPIRRLKSAPGEPRRGFTVFAFGGSQGAHTVNETMIGAVELLAGRVPGLRILHQTGVTDEAWVRSRYREMAAEAEVMGFVEDMGGAYGRADLVVCRAGATTLAELTALGKAAILVPYPYAADDHQRANAEVLVRADAAEMLLEADLTPERLAAAIEKLAGDRQRLQNMETAARTLAVMDATERVIAVCRDVAAGGNRDEHVG
jgi:UDP-N-acetylglucosamine--N-acetylmuramyl-(pentapeptide) pyrophosphoryl-undecaprenol N-acetylglucosamine transferase